MRICTPASTTSTNTSDQNSRDGETSLAQSRTTTAAPKRHLDGRSSAGAAMVAVPSEPPAVVATGSDMPDLLASRLAVSADEELTVVTVGGDLGRCTTNPGSYHDRVVADSLDLVMACRTLSVKAVGARNSLRDRNGVSSRRGCRDPPTVPVPPFRAKTLEPSAPDPNGSHRI
jgi:hypothetical protein